MPSPSGNSDPMPSPPTANTTAVGRSSAASSGTTVTGSSSVASNGTFIKELTSLCNSFSFAQARLDHFWRC